MGELFLENIIKELQLLEKLPTGEFVINTWDYLFSTVHHIAVGEKNYYCKILKQRADHDNKAMREKLVNEFESLNYFYPFFQANELYGIPRPVFFSSEHLMMITEEVPGIPVSSQIYPAMKRFSYIDEKMLGLCGNIGGCLKFFHGLGDTSYSVDDLDDLIDYIKKHLDDVVFSNKEMNKIYSWLYDKREKVKQNILSYKKNPTHHDLNLYNIYSNCHTVSLIDFGDFRYDHYFQDIISFKLMVDEFFVSKLKYSSKTKKKMVDAFCKGYGVDLVAIKNDGLYQLILLKNLSIFLKTFQQRKSAKRRYSLSGFKDSIINHFDLMMTKKAIIRLISGS